MLTKPSPSWSSPDQVLTTPPIHYLGPSAMMRQFQSLPHHSHITPIYYHKPHIITPHHYKISLPSNHHYPHHPGAQISHISLNPHITTHQLEGFQLHQPPPSLSRVPSAEAGSSLIMVDSQPYHLTIYAADTVSQGVPSVVKPEEETFDGVAEVWAWSVNETLVPCPRNGGGTVVKRKNSLTTCLGQLIPSLSYRAPAYPRSTFLTLRALSPPPLTAL